jgi:hypothetical protein
LSVPARVVADSAHGTREAPATLADAGHILVIKR